MRVLSSWHGWDVNDSGRLYEDVLVCTSILIHYHSQITFVCLNVPSGLTGSSDDSS